MAKTYRLENQHVDTGPLIDAVIRGFPHVLKEYPDLGQAEDGIAGIARVESPSQGEEDIDVEDVSAEEEASAAAAADTSLKGGQMALPLLINSKPVS